MLPSKYRLRKPNIFHVLCHGKKISFKNITYQYLPTNDIHPKWAIIVHIKNRPVIRVRIKRALARAIFSSLDKTKTPHHAVLTFYGGKNSESYKSLEAINEHIEKLFSRLSSIL
ncbi:MAG: ribonuclease P protein component [Patescibacteria group bacterium]|nr:ribonuclease P protein component [Patescibacteria group bacterium]